MFLCRKEGSSWPQCAPAGERRGDDPSVCGAVSSIPDVCEASHRAGSKEKKKIHENFEKSGKPEKCKK